MISCNKGKTEIKGDILTIMAEFSAIVHGLSDCLQTELTPDLAIELIKDAVNLGLKPKEKIHEDAEKVRSINKMVADLFKGVM